MNQDIHQRHSAEFLFLVLSCEKLSAKEYGKSWSIINPSWKNYPYYNTDIFLCHQIKT